ncbi:PAS domain S-box protein [Candidatus Ferrigenium straubiae]|jgi:diguanylate cyclase (GGDEF)-like protein/PAS domain S-box-containing protein|uniref:sensor domain-containing protein n=1 Tax=Candidatus Ferrigenium straubiae TaxID=2919506 RepID=UPI003F4A9FF6
MDLQKIINLMPGIVYQFRLRPDGSTCVPCASEATREIYELFRLDPAELREDASRMFLPVHPEDREGLMASIRASAQDLTPFQHEYRLKFDDGTVRWLRGNGLPQREADGSTLWQGFLTDITESKNGEERLRQSEEKLRAYLDNISDTVWLIDANLNMAYVSPSVTRLLGILPVELVGRPSALVIHPDDMNAVINAQRYVMEHPGEPYTTRYRVSHKDGRWIDVESTGVNLFANPAINGVLVTMRDITEHKQLETALRHSEETLSVAQSVAQIGSWFLDIPANRLEWSSEAYRIFGTPQQDAINMETFVAIVHPDDRDFVLRAWGEAMAGTPYDIEHRIAVDGKERWVRERARIERDPEGRPLTGIGTVQDITERKRVEEALRTSEHRYRLLVESSPLCIHEIDLEGRIQSMNRAGLDMLGLKDARNVCGLSYLGAVSRQDAESVSALMQDAISNGTSSYFEFVAAGDMSRHFKSCFIPIKDEGGKVLKLMGITEDITERKKIEDELKQTKERYDFATAIGKVGTWDWNPATGDLVWSDETFRLMGFAPGSVAPSYELFLGKVHPDDRESLDNAVRAALRDRKAYAMDCRIVADSGKELACHVTGKVEFDAKDQPVRMLGTIHDITERKAGEERLRKSEANQRAILDNSPYLTWLKDPAGRYLKVNKAYAAHARLEDTLQVVGLTDFDLWPKELAEKYRANDAEVMASCQQQRIEEPSLDGDRMLWVETFKSPVIDENGNLLGTVGFARDITERKQAEEQIRNLAFYDALTELPNRRLLDDRLRQAMATSKRSGLYGALMFFDLDNFKPLNDTYGHEVGDSLLVEAARRITGCVRKADTVARFGGDEFVVMLGELDEDRTGSISQARVVAEKIRTILAEPYILQFKREGHAETIVEHHCTSSIGVTLFIGDEAGPENLIKWADLAMYRAKEGGRNRVHFYGS